MSEPDFSKMYPKTYRALGGLSEEVVRRAQAISDSGVMDTNYSRRQNSMKQATLLDVLTRKTVELEKLQAEIESIQEQIKLLKAKRLLILG